MATGTHYSALLFKEIAHFNGGLFEDTSALPLSAAQLEMLTDAAAWLRHRLGLPPGRVPPRATRYWLLFGVLAAAAATGSLVWEVVNPVTLLPRELLFGFSSGIAVVVAVFIYDFLVAPRGWCGHLCPMGAFYAILGRYSLIRVRARRRDACTDCADDGDAVAGAADDDAALDLSRGDESGGRGGERRVVDRLG